MQAKHKWLLVPPALALVLFLGPLRDFGAPVTTTEAKPVKESTEAKENRPRLPTTQLPSIQQVASTLIGVLLLGGALVFALKKLRGGRAATPGSVLTLRQSLRLSPRHQLHAIGWDNRLLLVGETEGGVSVLREIDDPQALADERQVTTRDDEDDDGAVPRDMIIPRAPTRPARVTPPRSTTKPATAKSLDDFRALLHRAREGQSAS